MKKKFSAAVAIIKKYSFLIDSISYNCFVYLISFIYLDFDAILNTEKVVFESWMQNEHENIWNVLHL